MKKLKKRLQFVQDVAEAKVRADSQASAPIETIIGTAGTVKGATAILGVTGSQFANALASLPQNVADLAREMPAVAGRIKRAGVRGADLPRCDTDILKLFDSIPATSKLGRDPKTTIRQFLADKHASHIKPHAHGGSSEAGNIVWEVAADNIRRGAKTMTDSERAFIRIHNALDSILHNSGAITRMGLKVTVLATLSQVMVVALAYSLDLYRGDITVDEYKKLICETAKSVGLTTPIFFLLFVGVLALLPEFAVLLSAPVVVAGFNALAGLSLATPIIQSLIRHTEAGGFGDETSDKFQQLRESLRNQVDAWLQKGEGETLVVNQNSGAGEINFSP